MASVRKRGAVWYYRYVDADGVKQSVKGCSNERATWDMAHAAEAEAAKIRAGLIDPKDLAMRQHDARPLANHIRDWHAFMLAKESTAQHADLSRNRVTRVMELAKVDRISLMSPSKVQAALKAIRDTKVSLRSIHHYTRAVKAFSRWLWRDGRAREYTLAHLTSPNPETDRRRVRRALDADELRRILDAAERGPVVLKVLGPDRAMLYRLAMATGFRANELRTLTPEAFDLDGDPPTVTAKAAYSKRRRKDVQPIQSAMADALRPWLAARPSGKPLFGKLTKHTALMLRPTWKPPAFPTRPIRGPRTSTPCGIATSRLWP